jgi:bifunctional enzyme CysN/CysC
MNGREVSATVTSVKHRLDVETLRQEPARVLHRGDVGACTIATAAPLALDAFADLPQTARFALYDRYSRALIAAGTVDFALRRGVNVHLQPLAVSKMRRAALKGQGPCVLWFTGLSGAGKSTIANLVEGQLAQRGSHTYLLDGDNVRHGLNKNLGFTAADRVENIRRVGEVAKLFVDAGLLVLCSFISPFRAERAAVRDLVGPEEFIEIFVRAPLDVCERRDPKGLYAKSRAGELPNFTGIDSPYEAPESPDLVLDTTSAAAPELARRVVDLLETRRLIAASAPKQG